MDVIQQSQIGDLGPESPDSGETRRRVSRLLLLWPLAGIVLLLYDVNAYRPLDDTLIYWIGAAPCLIVATFISVIWHYPNVKRFFPRTLWLALACLFIPSLLLINGALDRSPIEQHRQVITRMILEHGRGGPFYYLELTSWRAGREHEKVMVSERWYLQAKLGDPAIVEIHSGALGMPLLVSVHRPD